MDSSKKLSSDKSEIISNLSANYSVPLNETQADVNFIEQQLELYKSEYNSLSSARKSGNYNDSVNRFAQVRIYNEIIVYITEIAKKNEGYANELDKLFKLEAEHYQIPHGM